MKVSIFVIYICVHWYICGDVYKKEKSKKQSQNSLLEGKGKQLEVCTVIGMFLRRTKRPSEENNHSRGHVDTYMQAHPCSCLWENYELPNVCFLHFLIVPSKPWWLLTVDPWPGPHFPEKRYPVATTVKVLPLPGVAGTSQDWYTAA